MPGVTSLRQDSETQTKPSYFRGHCWEAIGMVVGSMTSCFCLPLQLLIHLGFRHIGADEDRDNLPSMAERIVQMAIEFSVRNGRLSILVLDAFFPTAPVFRLACSVYSIEFKQPLVEILVRAKKTLSPTFPLNQSPKTVTALKQYWPIAPGKPA